MSSTCCGRLQREVLLLAMAAWAASAPSRGSPGAAVPPALAQALVASSAPRRLAGGGWPSALAAAMGVATPSGRLRPRPNPRPKPPAGAAPPLAETPRSTLATNSSSPTCALETTTWTLSWLTKARRPSERFLSTTCRTSLAVKHSNRLKPTTCTAGSRPPIDLPGSSIRRPCSLEDLSGCRGLPFTSTATLHLTNSAMAKQTGPGLPRHPGHGEGPPPARQ
mmetsp:Transcript_75653/g.233587  ORF Transcript_75653/g.233587 Transcript_75653/m.233587 type:complete len:222 (-) Transcript_75653:23-688(-)